MNTSYLSLTVSVSQTATPMGSFYSIQDSNYEIIDAFASNTAGSIASNLNAIGALSSNVTTLESALSSVATQLSGVYALTGTVTLYSASWNASAYTLAMPVLKLNDSVFFKPATASDQALLEAAHCFTSASVSQVTFTAETQPTSDINLKYTVTKGEPWVSLSVTETNCTHIGDNTVSTDDVTRLLFLADSGYKLPSSIIVTGATYTWDKDSGVLLLSDPTGPVSIIIIATEVVKTYGVSGLYQSSPTLTRTDDAVGMSATVNSSTGLVSSDFDNAFPWNEATVETIDGNKFLHMPDMWFRVGKDSSDRITDIAVSKAQGATGDWYKVDSFYYGCYGGSVSNDKLCSVSGVARQGFKTRTEFRTYASTNGAEYHQLDLYHHTVMLFLWWIEWANKDSQSIMRGKDGSIGGKIIVNTGGTDSLTTSSGFNTTTGQMRWHYIEDYIGNQREFVDGFVGSGSTYYVTADPSKFNDTGSGMNTLGYSYPSNASSENRCISAYGWDSNNPFLCEPKEQTGTDYTVHFCDTNAVTNRLVLMVGAGYASSGAASGVSFCGYDDASYNYADYGARLLYKPAS